MFITGASRGIGKAIALKAAADGANIVVAAKTAEPHVRMQISLNVKPQLTFGAPFSPNCPAPSTQRRRKSKKLVEKPCRALWMCVTKRK